MEFEVWSLEYVWLMMNEATRGFIREHLSDDVARLLLSAQRYPGVDMPVAAAQIRALQKVRDKIPAWYRPDLTFPPLVSVEQASSEQTARFKASLVSGSLMADLSGGMGVDAYFFARRFERAVYVERNPELAALAHINFATLGVHNIEVVNS
ncbi:MAG: SAM-dependent methyltransferase, partial [Thermoanaerobaculia bacterium]|nr:SAM-dependent methyltransferase [Thermoanaerobaculia bacterium]